MYSDCEAQGIKKHGITRSDWVLDLSQDPKFGLSIAYRGGMFKLIFGKGYISRYKKNVIALQQK